ncbi:MAG: AtpZ/AtpI family protein [Chloroflexi bacterium]|nr:AtpZ/AtpI family protein [Chloroflexota bacterium]MQC16754.1 AtpZ/AtpI family protein [Chloroflexota bacterium]MQC47885.1 AtpZ/AtpI family protein [Chloroflexota bacterium]
MKNSPAFALLGIGFVLGIWIAGGALLGFYLDGRFDSRPLFTLVFLFMGLAIGVYDMYRRLKDVSDAAEAERRRKGRA